MIKLFPDITTVEDSRKPMAIAVTARDERKAKPGNPAQCAVACAAKRTVPGLRGALINKTSSYLIYQDGRAVRYRTPVSTYAKIIAFDMAGIAEKGIYTLGAVPPSHLTAEMQRRTGISATQQEKKAKRLKKSHKRTNPVTFIPTRIRSWGSIETNE
jgi:hypothetical protein